MSDAPTLLVLHGLRLQSVAEAGDVARRYGLEELSVRRTLGHGESQGWVLRREGVVAGWALTRDGRREGERLLADELARSGARDVVASSYRRFRHLNGELLSVCADWQVVRRGGREVPNSHDDPAHDAAVLARLRLLHTGARPVVEQLGQTLDRMSGYAGRLERAFERVVSGETQWLTRVSLDSYHTVWFELHEDLLATLGRSRATERSAATPPHDAAEPSAADPRGPGTLPDRTTDEEHV